MAFDYTNLYPDTSGNGGYTKSWNYTTVVDSIATCSASGYFNKVATRLGIGDNIVVARVDAFETKTRTALIEYATLYVNGISGGVVTTLPSTTGYATTTYVDAGDATTAANAAAATALKANIASPTFTGTPAAPTATPGTNTTQLATTAGIVAERAATKTLTNTTYDTAGTGNSFSIAGAAANANTGTGAIVRATSPALVTPALGTPASGNLANCTGYVQTSLIASLGADVVVNNISNYFDGPSVAQGSTGTWFASGTVTVTDTVSANFYAKLWDGTTVIASGTVVTGGSGVRGLLALSGVITNPTGNLRISVRNPGDTTGTMEFNRTGNSKDSTISVVRIA